MNMNTMQRISIRGGFHAYHIYHTQIPVPCGVIVGKNTPVRETNLILSNSNLHRGADDPRERKGTLLVRLCVAMRVPSYIWIRMWEFLPLQIAVLETPHVDTRLSGWHRRVVRSGRGSWRPLGL